MVELQRLFPTEIVADGSKVHKKKKERRRSTSSFFFSLLFSLGAGGCDFGRPRENSVNSDWSRGTSFFPGVLLWERRLSLFSASKLVSFSLTLCGN
jgi:hypothetical protein